MDATQERRSVEAITQKKAPTYSAVCPAAKPTGMKPAAVISVPAWQGIDLHIVSLGTLIVSLGLLVDDAIIVIEMMQVKLEEGMDRLAAAQAAV